MLTDRANVICVLEVLKEHSDSEHILPMRELISKISSAYDIKPDRRTVYSAISLLAQLGYDISTFEENGIGYYLRSRDFEPSEILLLADAVYAFPFIPPKQSEQLVKKLQNQLSSHRRKEYKNLTIVKPERKTDNRQVFWSIEQLDKAITAGCKVSFTYLQRDVNKELVPRRSKPYIVSPYRLVYTNEHYYLVCSYETHPGTSFYRIDRMRDITVLADESVDGKIDEAEIDHAIYAFAGKSEQITLRCDKGFLDDVMDRFGLDLRVTKEANEQISVSFKAAPQGVKFWALQYLPYIEITEPKWLRDDIIECLKNNPYIKGG